MRNSLFLLLVLLSACGGSSNSEETASRGTDEPIQPAKEETLKTWTLSSYGSTDTPNQIAEGIQVTLQMDLKEGKISGVAACNNYFGSINGDEDPYRFGKMGSTRKLCADAAVNEMETTFLAMMEKVTKMTFENQQLVLEVEGDQRMTFSAM